MSYILDIYLSYFFNSSIRTKNKKKKKSNQANCLIDPNLLPLQINFESNFCKNHSSVEDLINKKYAINRS